MKTCTKCFVTKSDNEFYANRADCKECKKAQSSAHGKSYYQDNKEHYREMHRQHYKNNKAYYIAKGAKRRAAKLNATPFWVDKEKLNKIYKIAQDKGLVVDHIIPLNHPDVCGLHVPANLRCISQEWNAWKSNKLLNTEHFIKR